MITTDTVTRELFGHTADGTHVERIILRNGALSASLITYGATWISFQGPDRTGTIGEVLLGADTLEAYLDPTQPYIGSTVGRYANRIAHGRFTLDGQAYTLAINNGVNHLHGGPGGFHRRVWAAITAKTASGPSATFSYQSPAGEEGYPGALAVQVCFTLLADGMKIEYSATTDAPTVVNLTNHAYINLAGHGSIADHTLQILSDTFLVNDPTQIPTGEQRAVDGTAFDLRAPQRIGDIITRPDPQLAIGDGIDHCWVRAASTTPQFIARVVEPASGRVLSVETTEPGIQCYTGNNLSGEFVGRNSVRYQQYGALCLETQHLPDSPNQPAFPSTVLRPGERYTQTTLYRLGVEQ